MADDNVINEIAPAENKPESTPETKPKLKKNALVSVLLIKPHRHAGRDYPAKAILNVDEATAQWLINNKIGERYYE